MSYRWRQRRKRCYEWLNRFDKASRERSLEEMLRRVLRSSNGNRKTLESCSGQRESVSLPLLKGSGKTEKNEPLIDVFEDQESVIVVTELIGIDRSRVDLHTTREKLTISIDSPDRKHHREIQLPTKVDVGSSSSRLKNGVLEIHLKKLRGELVAR